MFAAGNEYLDGRAQGPAPAGHYGEGDAIESLAGQCRSDGPECTAVIEAALTVVPLLDANFLDASD